jgi:hypothetical protein
LIIASGNTQLQSSIHQTGQAFRHLIVIIAERPWPANNNVVSAPGLRLCAEADKILEFLFVTWRNGVSHVNKDLTSVLAILNWLSTKTAILPPKDGIRQVCLSITGLQRS